MTTVSRAPFARTEIVRRNSENYSDCSYCGQQRTKSGLYATSAPRIFPLWEYGTERDDRPGESNVNWHKGLFCSKGCHDAYHS